MPLSAFLGSFDLNDFLSKSRNKTNQSSQHQPLVLCSYKPSANKTGEQQLKLSKTNMKPSIILTILGLSLTAIAAPTPGNCTQSFPFKLIRIIPNQTEYMKTLKLVMLMPKMPILLLQPLQPLPHPLVLPLFQLLVPLQTHPEKALEITL